MDYHLYGRIVKQSYRYAANAIVEWQKSEEPLPRAETAQPREVVPSSSTGTDTYQHFSWAQASTASSIVSEQHQGQSILSAADPSFQPPAETNSLDGSSSIMNDLLEAVLAEQNGTTPSFQPRMARVRTTKTLLQSLEEEEGDAAGMSMSSLSEENEGLEEQKEVGQEDQIK